MQRPGLGEKAAQVAGLPAASIMMEAAHLLPHMSALHTHMHIGCLCSPSQPLLAHRNTRRGTLGAHHVHGIVQTHVAHTHSSPRGTHLPYSEIQA